MLESFCALNFLGKLDDHTSSEMIKLVLDRKIYDHMMSRKVNFRPSDSSSIFNYPDSEKYINRLFEDGDESVIPKIKNERPILNVQTHNILAFSKPLWNAFGDKLTMLEIVRHPVYMFNQIYTSAISDLIGNIRNWTLQINSNFGIFPFNYLGFEDKFSEANNYEKTIIFITSMIEMTESFKQQNKKLLNNLITISFEQFVLRPHGYIDEICSMLNTKKTKYLAKELERANVPRKKVTSVPDIDVYKKCGGWSEGIKDFSDRQEVDMRMEIIKNNVSSEIFSIFEDCCQKYEETYWKPNP